MISKLKSRPRTDRLGAEPMRRRRNWDRAAYMGLLLAFGLGLANYVMGERLFLRADGIVMQDRIVVGATSLVRVSRIDVRPGQPVEAGDVLMQAESLDVLGRLADLSMQDATLAEREAQLRSELRVAERLQPLSEARLTELETTLGRIETAGTARLIPVTRREAVEQSVHAARAEAATLAAQAEGLDRELTAVGAARQHARRAIADLNEHYADGMHRAGASGVIGDEVPAVGEVFNPGDPIVTLLWGEPHVLAYLPDSYVFGVEAGDRVRIDGGAVVRTGMVEAILPVSQSVPDEFRNAFRPDETRQLARVTLDPGGPLPTHSAVRITRHRDLDGLRRGWRSVEEWVRTRLPDAPLFAHRVADLWGAPS